MATWVEPDWGGRPYLICIFHTKAAGASFPLPAVRPDEWPDLTLEEMQVFMTQGATENEARGDDDGSE
jgi:hypothetical protein